MRNEIASSAKRQIASTSRFLKQTAMASAGMVAMLIVGSAAAASTSWQFQTVDSVGDTGQFTSLALDAAGNPRIAYYDRGNRRLCYASWSGSGWATEIVDSSAWVGSNCSLVLTSDGRPCISYLDTTNYDLKYAEWDGWKWSTQTVDSYGDVGWSTSLALDNLGRPHISYWAGYRTNRVKYAAWNGSSWLTEVVDSDSG